LACILGHLFGIGAPSVDEYRGAHVYESRETVRRPMKHEIEEIGALEGRPCGS